jgi:cellulose synthase operon protein C
MTFRPERGPLMLLAAVLLAAAGTASGPLSAAPGADAIAEAKAAIARGDGLAAEMAGKQAMQQGAARADVAAVIGEGELLQGDLADARNWLGAADFSSTTRNRGLYALAKLELTEDNLMAASAVFDRILANGGGTAAIWVDIGRLRYRQGQHHAALQAAARAMALDGNDPRALEFMAQLTRDAHGVREALPLFQRATQSAPDDASLAMQYAATLGDAGEHRQMLQVIRASAERHDAQPQAFYLQAILAARAGNDDLARKMWWRTDGAYDRTGAGLLVSGVLEYRSGNPAAAAERFAELTRLQPFNTTAQILFARALVANGEANVAVSMLEPLAQREDASAYVLLLLARAYEQLGNREDAAAHLDRAALAASPSLAFWPAPVSRDDSGRARNPDDVVQRIRTLVAEGNQGSAAAEVRQMSAQFEGSIDIALLAGDIALLSGDALAAASHYRRAGGVRRNWPLVRRDVALLTAAGDLAGARQLLADYLRANPREQAAAAMLGRMHLQAQNPQQASVYLRHAATIGPGPFDALLLSDLATSELAEGRREVALNHATAAHQLARGNRRVAAVLERVKRLQGVPTPR